MLYDITELRSLFGDDVSSFNELMENFVADSLASSDSIDAACISGDQATIKTELHKFNGMVGTMHIVSIEKMLKNIEREINESGLNEKNITTIQFITTTIREIAAEIVNELKK